MDIVVHGLDKGAKPVSFVQHMYSLDGDTLVHLTDGMLRAQVPPEGYAAFVVDHPDAAALLLESTPDIETRAAEAKLERARQFAAIRQKVSPGADQNAISKIVEREVAKALAQFIALQEKARAAAAAAPATPAGAT